MKLEEKLSTLRKEKNLSQLELAETLGVSRQAISKWESGNSVPSVDNLKALGRIYEVPLEYLLHDDEPRPTHCGQEAGNTEHEPRMRAAARRWTLEKIVILILGVLLAISLAVNGILAVIVYNYKANEVTLDEMQREELEQSELDEMQDFPLWW